MKNILITGANSYVGTNVEKWLMREPEKYHVETLDMKNPNWKDFDFSKFDVVFHVAGIAHVSSNKSMDDLYFKVNRDLAIETATKAKQSNVNHFIFMSSMIIYGFDHPLRDKMHIKTDHYHPINAYGKSKLEADLEIQKLASEIMNITIVRSPVIYGPGCKGNFPKLQILARKVIFFPNITNQRSMIFIDNLSEFIKHVIEKKIFGVFYPQNSEYLSTSMIILYTRDILGKKTYTFRFLNPLIRFLTIVSKFFRKIFGNKTYDLNISNNLGFDYQIVGVKDSVQKSINLNK